MVGVKMRFFGEQLRGATIANRLEVTIAKSKRRPSSRHLELLQLIIPRVMSLLGPRDGMRWCSF
jgi:hypothetical protein